MEKLNIIIESSARHAHVTEEHLSVLFGEGWQLNNVRELSQPGQYLTEEKIRVEGPRGGIDRVSILGPERKQTQVEISYTDARILGVNPPLRESGDVAGSAPVKLIGPAGSVELEEGCIVAKRHIHTTPEDAAKYGLVDKSIVKVKVDGPRSLTMDEVVVRVSPSFQTRMHIDYDEANAAMLSPGQTGLVIID